MKQDLEDLEYDMHAAYIKSRTRYKAAMLILWGIFILFWLCAGYLIAAWLGAL